MELATTLSVIQTILTSIQTLDELTTTIFSFSHLEDVKGELANLLNRVNDVKYNLEVAESRKGALNSQEKNYFEVLKGAIYDADDVLDVFVTLLRQNQEAEFDDLQNIVSNFKSVLRDDVSDQYALSSQERYYIKEFDDFVTLIKEQDTSYDEVLSQVMKSSLFGFINYTDCVFDKIKKVNNKFDEIASKNKLCFKADTKPTKSINRESSSIVSVNDPIIGRGEDLEKIIDMLINSGDDHQPSNVSYLGNLAIVGIGGLGKTALAQLVYNDPRITSAFQVKSWTCIADHDRENWSLTELVRKVARGLLKGIKIDDSASLQEISDLLKKYMEGKKYLLVLDDVWTENKHLWEDLEKHLNVGKIGSHIVVTTRSKRTAEIIGGVRVHELQGLSEDDSWHSFIRMAFRLEQRENPDVEFVKLGKDIVKKCFNVPLVIRVVGSLLYGEPKRKWLSFRDKELTSINENDDTLNNILKLSYHQLDSSLKSCFAYCAIFPKDFRIDKELLISLWMAQGYINEEDKGEEYFHILLQRCFFQIVEEQFDEDNIITRFKIHDLLHDIAEQVAGKEVYKLISGASNMDTKVRHLSILHGVCPKGIFDKTHIRSCLQFMTNGYAMMGSDMLLANIVRTNLSSLRSLDLSSLRAETLPESICELLHLRYLNLAWSKNLKVLPDSITKLVNLQTLDLSNCLILEELTKDICKLVDLSTLDITRCFRMSHMPPNLNLLTKLHKLGHFVVGGRSSYGQQCFYNLEVLRDLNNLKGCLYIKIDVSENVGYVKENYGGGAYLINKAKLNKIWIVFINEDEEHESIGNTQMMLLEDMQPHENIKELELECYNGEKMPRWGMREDNSTLFHFPNLVRLLIHGCGRLQFLPSLENLPHLQKLELQDLINLEYLINVNLEECNLSEGTIFFPCLKDIFFTNLPMLKGWWPGSSGEQIGKPLPCFGQLSDLLIIDSPKLTYIPICSCLKDVMLVDNGDDTRSEDTNSYHELKMRFDRFPKSYKYLLPKEGESRMIDLLYLRDNFERYFDKPYYWVQIP